MNIKNIFSEQDKKEIAEAIKKVEKVTSGEIVPMVVQKSSEHQFIDVWFSLGFAYFFSFAINILFPLYEIWLFIICHIIGIIIGLILMKITPLKALLIIKKLSEKKIYRAALLSFYTQGLHKTRDKTGILIYISLLEHQVLVLGDEGINKKVKQDDWNNVVQLIVDGIKNKNLKEGIIAGILSCKQMLQTHFPIKPNDTNELSDEVVVK